MTRGKYIIFKTKSENEFPILFPAFLNHYDIFQAMKTKISGEAISAGLFEIINGDDGLHVSAHGNSHTLSLSSRKREDKILIGQMICDPMELSKKHFS